MINFKAILTLYEINLKRLINIIKKVHKNMNKIHKNINYLLKNQDMLNVN